MSKLLVDIKLCSSFYLLNQKTLEYAFFFTQGKNCCNRGDKAKVLNTATGAP